MSRNIPADNIKVKRAYEPPSPQDGERILVDRLWPRGISKDDAKLELWMKEISPSNELRKWYNHDASRQDEFRRRYAEELKAHQDLVEDLRERARKGPVTLVYSAKDETLNNAIVLRDLLLDR
ncbi:DUF488 domain-containing protein [Pseudaminobacter arsenicus]|uniref:DUF488 domain-containing protein n=1 Tax=Borborobacter arsenicus TaxID=1851146 RepID=A0A432V603_9HYPH|nr:DUF488 domain-containing protein [Pseudaminobacter arsenicus]RUM97604.1 DUF488 domain-containing protein [Pseudaminobacter arsenicus]